MSRVVYSSEFEQRRWWNRPGKNPQKRCSQLHHLQYDANDGIAVLWRINSSAGTTQPCLNTGGWTPRTDRSLLYLREWSIINPMTDMLVKLYRLPPVEADMAALEAAGVTIRRALAPEKHFVEQWVGKHFDAFWQSECGIAIGRNPPTCWIAVEKEQLVGFCCYDTSAKGFLGPIGVDESQRGRGVGRVLLVACLHAMRLDGYGYAIIGGVGPVEFYEKTVGATIIEDSTPGVYRGLLQQ